jgi:hypothetical protein
MTAYVIVDIKVTDPVRYEGYKKLAAPTVELYGENTSRAAARRKSWKESGPPIAWWFCNSKAWNRQKPG